MLSWQGGRVHLAGGPWTAGYDATLIVTDHDGVDYACDGLPCAAAGRIRVTPPVESRGFLLGRFDWFLA